MTENFPNFTKQKQQINLQIQEDEKISKRKHPKKFTPRHIVVTALKTEDKENILKEAKEK